MILVLRTLGLLFWVEVWANLACLLSRRLHASRNSGRPWCLQRVAVSSFYVLGSRLLMSVSMLWRTYVMSVRGNDLNRPFGNHLDHHLQFHSLNIRKLHSGLLRVSLLEAVAWLQIQWKYIGDSLLQFLCEQYAWAPDCTRHRIECGECWSWMFMRCSVGVSSSKFGEMDVDIGFWVFKWCWYWWLSWGL